MKDLSKEEITNLVGSSKFKEIGEFVNGYRINVNDEYVMLCHVCMYLQNHDKTIGGRHLDCTSHEAKCMEAKKLLKEYIEKYSLWPSNVNRLKSEIKMSCNENALTFIDELYQNKRVFLLNLCSTTSVVLFVFKKVGYMPIAIMPDAAFCGN